MKTFLSISLLFILLLPYYSCNKPVPIGTPKCIRKLINQEKKIGCLGEVYRYDYMGKEVYYFVPDNKCSDWCASLVDENCNSLKDGNGNVICACGWGQTINCDDFYTNRTNEKLIWKK